MADFKDILKEIGEVGEVEQVFGAVVYASGLPGAKSHELVMMETGEIGEVFSLRQDYLEILLFSPATVRVGTRVARMGRQLSVSVGEGCLGRVVDSLGRPVSGEPISGKLEMRSVDVTPPPISARKHVSEPFESGVSIVDLVVPLGRGQRELVIGDHKEGKTNFLWQSLLSHTLKGGVCVYGGIARRRGDLYKLNQYLAKFKIADKVVVVNSLATDSGGMIFLTPLTAMTMAEYFRDQGKDVLLILDDLSIHAKYYREISLLARRFPGRGLYPGDMYYLHAKLLERGGSFKNGSITCLAVAETVFGSLTGFIETNLMSMTDGHILFDHELSNQGRHPPVNPFLSVTRVGRQTQSPLMRSLTLVLNNFLVEHEKVKQLVHFGGEINQAAQRTLEFGDKIYALFNQGNGEIVPTSLSAVLLAYLWSGVSEGEIVSVVSQRIAAARKSYLEEEDFRARVGELFTKAASFDQLVIAVRQEFTLWKNLGGKPK